MKQLPQDSRGQRIRQALEAGWAEFDQAWNVGWRIAELAFEFVARVIAFTFEGLRRLVKNIKERANG